MTDLRALDAAATPGPWRPEQSSDRMTVFLRAADSQGSIPVSGLWPEDAALIAATRNALPYLLDVVDAARAINDALALENYCPDHAAHTSVMAALAALDAALEKHP
jgi:hypothetical protein